MTTSAISRVLLIVCLVAAIGSGLYLPLFHANQLPRLGNVKVSLRDTRFIHFLLPKIDKANVVVLKQRQRIEDYSAIWHRTHHLNHHAEAWLEATAKQYHIKPFDFRKDPSIQQLLLRVDEVPASLVLAQAINESAWGQSRFAREGNNLFGQWCYTAGCGIVPHRRPAGATYEVAKFATVYDSVSAYFTNINSNSAYAHLWQIRAQQRHEGRPVMGYTLAAGLVNYSQRGAEYVGIMRHIIKNYHLSRYD